MEQHRIQRRLLELGVEIVASHAVIGTVGDGVRAVCAFTERERELPCRRGRDGDRAAAGR